MYVVELQREREREIRSVFPMTTLQKSKISLDPVLSNEFSDRSPGLLIYVIGGERRGRIFYGLKHDLLRHLLIGFGSYALRVLHFYQ